MSESLSARLSYHQHDRVPVTARLCAPGHPPTSFLEGPGTLQLSHLPPSSSAPSQQILFLHYIAFAKLDHYQTIGSPHQGCISNSDLPSELYSSFQHLLEDLVAEKVHLHGNVLRCTSAYLRTGHVERTQISGSKTTQKNGSFHTT